MIVAVPRTKDCWCAVPALRGQGFRCARPSLLARYNRYTSESGERGGLSRLRKPSGSVTPLFPLARMIGTGQEFSIVARRHEFRSRRPSITKCLRLMLLQSYKNKSSGMTLLQETTAPASRASMASQGNSIRICTFREMSVRERRARKSLRMISLQNSKNKPSGMISLQKKVGGRGGVAHFPCQTIPLGVTEVGRFEVDKRGGRVQFLPPSR